MTETVTVTPASPGLDSDGDPVTRGTPVQLTPIEIAPGNTLIRYGVGADLVDVNFTVYLPLTVYTGDAWVATESVVRTGDIITVRGEPCVAMVQVWRSQRGGNRGGVAVLARLRTGRAA